VSKIIGTGLLAPVFPLRDQAEVKPVFVVELAPILIAVIYAFQKRLETEYIGNHANWAPVYIAEVFHVPKFTKEY